MRKFTTPAAGAVLVGAVVLTGSASADPINWEGIATCESGGNWSAEAGGGLAISDSDWGAHGGVGVPSQASPQQQIAVAKRIMADRGPEAWAACASRGGGAAPVGSLTHYLTALHDSVEGTGAPAD